ncbi:hypothetical protein [Pseudomonas alkylphenolica]|uniref:hypothetical protein n=1 Tax=Pseudomonas alkylphenolica TaxID=237609 RepID=UPI0018D9CE4F|nr:hypothetical protein [Pseudomonas alkylphenolica]MBH3429130.1 hypothetical protein [Pseudomonas alkylphenolica]
MKDLEEVMAAGKPLMQQATEALRIYNEAKGSVSPEEELRLWREAEYLFEAVHEFQRRALGWPVHSLH